MKYFSTLIFLLIVSLAISCTRKEYTEEGINEIKKEIDSLLHKPDAREEFDWGSASAYSTFRAYFHNSKLIFINEDYRYRTPGDSFNRYYFKDGDMLYYIGKELAFKPQKGTRNIEMVVDPDGNVIKYNKVVNGIRENLSSEEAVNIVEHARELEKIVAERSKVYKR